MHNLHHILNLDATAKIKRLKKGDILQRQGSTSATTFYVSSGLLRSYIIDNKGKEHIFMFAPEKWLIADVEALEFNEPVKLYIDCLEDSEVITFDKNCLFKADLSKNEIAENGKLLYRRIGRLQRRVLMLMSASAADRYQYFLETYPQLPNRVPQHMIASFIGIAPQTLSTIRAKIAKAGS